MKLALEQTTKTQMGSGGSALHLVISSFRREVDENCALLGYYAATRLFITDVLGNLSIPHWRDKNPKNMGRIDCPETSQIYYHYSLHNNPEEGRSQLYSFFNLGARWRWVVNATPRLLNSRERNPVPTVFLAYV